MARFVAAVDCNHGETAKSERAVGTRISCLRVLFPFRKIDSNRFQFDGRLVTVFERKSAVSEIANVSVHIDLEYTWDSSSASMTDFTPFASFYTPRFSCLSAFFRNFGCVSNVLSLDFPFLLQSSCKRTFETFKEFPGLRDNSVCSNSRALKGISGGVQHHATSKRHSLEESTERSRFATSCMRKACLKRNFEVGGVEAERNVVQGERDSTKRDSVHLAAILDLRKGLLDKQHIRIGLRKASVHSTECCTVKFPNIPISRDEAESENHLSQRGLLSLAAPTSSGSEKTFFADWHPPQEYRSV
ncbi:hypothetical protein ALC57_08181 [Trachymyrmex cornetzi]|uniref:Uncharacterized protein n=1 Tax=Trachymyrmex cornetzi TaxID=471704 RepID=A0A195E2V8_9HYME|nr:hypothetical protein ALC57_08181 [Trachymyrmex cornetzi]